MSQFQSYFEKIYGSRWPALFDALKRPEKQVRFSPFQVDLETIVSSPDDFAFENKEDALERTEDGFLANYILDPASLMPVLALRLNEKDKVLDLCAAPGGKSLAILSQLGENGSLLSNDSSPDRAIRLRKVLSQYTPQNKKDSYRVLQKDGTKFGFFFKEEFDRILVDAPCSSERHWIHQGKLPSWTEKRAKFLSVKQYTLLCAALLCAKPGARIVYSTCSINPVENDDVISKLLKKKGDRLALEAMDIDALGVEKTEHGLIVLPDRLGYGPIYLCALRVKEDHEPS